MDAESQVITAICVNKDIVPAMASGAGDLFVSHKDVWEFLVDYYQRYRTVPDVGVLQDRFRDFTPARIDGATQYYVDSMRNAYISSKLRNTLLTAGQGISSLPTDDVIRTMQSDLSVLSKLSSGIRDVDMTDIEDAERHFEAVRERSAAMGGAPGILSGFKAMDMAYPTGMAPGHLVVLIGWPGRGKSFFSALLAIRAWEQGFSPLIFSLEMSPEDYRNRVYALMASGLFKVSDFQQGAIDIDNFRSWGRKSMAGKQSFTVVSSDGMTDVTPTDVQAKIDQYRPDLVVCHAKGTRILTDNVWMNVEDYENAYDTYAPGKRIYLSGVKEPEVVTLDHRYWARTRNGVPQWIKAVDLTEHHYIGYRCHSSQYGLPRGVVPDSLVPYMTSKRFWSLLGTAFGKGQIDGDSITVTTRDRGVYRQVMAVLKRAELDSYVEDEYSVTFEWPDLARWLSSLNGIIPEWMQHMERHLLSGFAYAYRSCVPFRSHPLATHENNVLDIMLAIGGVAPVWNKSFIHNSYLWRKVESSTYVDGAVFCPIKTPNGTYHTLFGMSHNCDYHQLFTDSKRSKSEVERNRNISREFKLLAVSNSIPVIDITAATANDPSDQDVPPMLSQVAWSKAIEYDADAAMAIHQHADTDIIEVVSRKARHGTNFGFYLKTDLNRGIMEESYGDN